VPNLPELINRNSSDHCLVLNLQCGLSDINYNVSVIKKQFLKYEDFHVWDKLRGLDAGFYFSASGTVDYPDALAGMRAGLHFNRLGGEFLYHDRSYKEHLGTGAFVNDNYFDFRLELPNRVVRDILTKIMVFNRVYDQNKNTFGVRIDITNLSSDSADGAAVSFEIARIYI
jgi:hypothetical protein